MTGQRLLTTTLILAILMVAWDEIRRLGHTPPVPARFIGVAVVWGTLGVLAAFGADVLAAAMSCGLLLALVYNYYNGTSGKNPAVTQSTSPRGGVNDRGVRPNA